MSGLRIEVSGAVPSWLASEVTAAHARHDRVLVVLAPDDAMTDPEERAGWEIGVLTTVLSMGADDVHGADPVRLRRVRAVVDRWEQG